MSELSPEAAKVLAARRAAVEELRLIDKKKRKVDDHAVKRLASARLFSESIELRMIAGEVVSAAEIKAASLLVEEARAAAERSDVKLEITVVGRDHKPISSLPVRAPEPSTPSPTLPPDGKPTGDDARQADPPSSGNVLPFSRSPCAPDYTPEPQADSMSPCSVSFGGGSNNWGWQDGGSGPFSDPHPYLNWQTGKGRY